MEAIEVRVRSEMIIAGELGYERLECRLPSQRTARQAQSRSCHMSVVGLQDLNIWSAGSSMWVQ